MKRKKKKLPAERIAVEVRYAYEGHNSRKTITVSLVKIDPANQVTERNIVTSLHPNAKKRAFDSALTLSRMSAYGAVSNLIIDENLMRDEYCAISKDPILIKEVS